MLNIYYANESINKEKFIFEHIAQTKGRTILIVPDQFSAQTERNAFFYLGTKAIMDLRIFHLERLGHKALQEVGTPVPPLIDKYGRFMILDSIMRRERDADNLVTYKGVCGKSTFTQLMNQLISEMKRNEIVPDMIAAVEKKLDERTFLRRKLSDIRYIFGEYEKAIEGKYLDSEDYITFYGDAIEKAPMIKGAQVWIYGFDAFTPKNYLVISRLLKAADCVNIVMNYERGGEYRDAAFLAGDDRKSLFDLSATIIDKLKELAQQLGEEVAVIPLEADERRTVWSQEDGGASNICLVGASSVYHEAERAASYILDLVRNQGYSFGDISVICNDMKGLGSVLGRTFDKWGIPAFIDNKRKVLHQPAVGFLLALMDIIAHGFTADAAMRLIKTGLFGCTPEDGELLENYLLTYRIRGKAWKEPFTRKTMNMTDEELETVNTLRANIVALVEKSKESVGQRNSAEDKVKGLYEYLTNQFEITDKLETVIKAQEEAGLVEAADATAQSWNVICSIFNQIVSIVGSNKLSNVELKNLLEDGLAEVEIGLVPVNPDSVIIGAVQRTRLSRTKVLLVVGANEGVLPINANEEGILSENEKATLGNMDIVVGKSDSVMRSEEALAIYRNLTAPSDKLYMSYSKTDVSGADYKPSRIFTELANYAAAAGNGRILDDLENEDEIEQLISTPEGTLSHVARVVREAADGEEVNDDWQQVINWYLDHEIAGFDKMRQGMAFNNTLDKLGKKFAQALYVGDRDEMRVSASRLEKFSACPFAHFMNYGLRLEELQPYEIGARETGDIYHECLMKFSQKLTPTDGTPINDASSPWMSISEEKCGDIVRKIITEEMRDYKDDLMSSSRHEAYRVERIINVCSQVAMSMVRQIQKGDIRAMYFEEAFDSGADLEPIKVKVGDKDVLLRGKIDRMDIINTTEGSAVRIVDYKTGKPKIKKEYYEAGYKLQLLVYLNAALANDSSLVPAGVFHFNIEEMDEANDDGKASDKTREERLDKKFRLKGFVLDEENVIRSMDKEFEKESMVIPVKEKAKGGIASAAQGQMLSRDEFSELCDTVNHQVERLCGEILDGSIEIAPKQDDERAVCNYCEYRSICMFDTGLKGCRYVKV